MKMIANSVVRLGYFDDNIKGGTGPNVVGGEVDLEQARPVIAQQNVVAQQPQRSAV